MTEREMFLNGLEREHQTTLKVLRAFPEQQADFKPHEKSRTAKELAWNFVTEQEVAAGAIQGQVNFANMPKPPATFGEVIKTYESKHKDFVAKVKAMSDNAFEKETVQFPVGPKQMQTLRKGDVLWFTMMDHVHHRGQFSVYLRMKGGKVPSIYGPSADEPWM